MGTIFPSNDNDGTQDFPSLLENARTVLIPEWETFQLGWFM
jgi:hypothetical protein